MDWGWGESTVRSVGLIAQQTAHVRGMHLFGANDRWALPSECPPSCLAKAQLVALRYRRGRPNIYLN